MLKGRLLNEPRRVNVTCQCVYYVLYCGRLIDYSDSSSSSNNNSSSSSSNTNKLTLQKKNPLSLTSKDVTM